MSFRIRGVHVQLEINPAAIARDFEGLARLRERLIQRARGDEAAVDRFLAQRLGHALESAARQYDGEMGARLDTISRLRDDLTGVYESVMRGEFPRPDVVRKVFTDLDREMGALVSPTRHAEGLQTLDLPPAAPVPGRPRVPEPVRQATLVHALGDRTTEFRDLDPDTQGAIARAADSAPGDVRRAVVAESREGFTQALTALTDALRREGMSDPDLSRLRRGLESLNDAYRRALREQDIPDARLRQAAAVGRLTDPALREVAGRSRTLSRLAEENPTFLTELWLAFREKPRNYTFRQYVVYAQRIVRGLYGEYQAAFRLGDDFVFLKGPDHQVTLPGTDLVAVCRRTGEILVIDNKAYRDAVVSAVDALTRNLPPNLADDVRAFQARFGGRFDTPPAVAGAVARLAEASRRIQTIVAGKTPAEIRSPAIQQQITAVLSDPSLRIERVVTGAGGNVTALTPALEALGIDLRDLP